jgi:hypothetical protein
MSALARFLPEQKQSQSTRVTLQLVATNKQPAMEVILDIYFVGSEIPTFGEKMGKRG